MPFNSIAFVVFFAAVLLVHSLPLPWTFRKFNLLIAGYVFYAAWDVSYVALLLSSTAVNGIAGKLMTKFDGRPGIRRSVLWIGVLLNLGMLAGFKYGNQFLWLAQAFSNRLGFGFSEPKTVILLPVGLSFFTFQAMSYTIDVYRRTIKPATSNLDLALFIAFFPVLLAGPILRAGQFLPQCERPTRATGFDFGWGLCLFVLGLFLKVVLADHLLAPIVNQVFDVKVHPETLTAWIGTLAFTAQDYCDFAGYSVCAIGIGRCLGFVLPPNFRAPLASIGFRDLWQRWHITLVAWMRDYVFNPLGGVSKGYARAALNIMITMLLIGLWHGATATFAIFGILHGIFLVGETLLQRTRLRRSRLWSTPIGKILLWAVTMVLCQVAIVFYRSGSVEQSLRLLWTLIGGFHVDSPFRLSNFDLLVAGIVLPSLIIAHWLCRETALEVIAVQAPRWSISISLAVMLVAILLTSGESQGFLYFQY
jgi:alginate O-acetyltransferase complex protein AlgI